MPQLNVKTVKAAQIWTSPDGQRKIYDLQLEWDGKAVKAKTYSDTIATEGWEGEVETYEKPGRNNKPAETFVRQAPKEDGGGYGGSNRTGTQGSRGYQPKDEKAIQAMWAIGQAVQLAISAKETMPPEWIEASAQELFTMVARVKAVPEDEAPEEPTVEPMPEDFGKKPDEPQADQVSLEELGKVMSDVTDVSEEDTPWDKTAS